MTTIVADLLTLSMVSDSKSSGENTQGDTHWVPTTKIFRWGDALIGFAGDLKDRQKWLDWNNGGRKGRRPRFKKNGFEAIVLRRTGVFYLSDDQHEQVMERDFGAIGSGEQAATAALLLGASPHTAVSIGCAIDNNSGGDIQTAYL